MTWSTQAYILSVAIVILVGVALACRRSRYERPCSEHPSGEHSLILARDERGMRLRCMDCGCKSTGWAVFPRAVEVKK